MREPLDDAKASRKRLCSDGKEKKDCRTATTRVDTLTDKWANAGTTLLSAPIPADEGDVGRASAWLAGYVIPRQVSLYLPLLWPATMALLSGFFLGGTTG